MYIWNANKALYLDSTKVRYDKIISQNYYLMLFETEL